MALNINTNIGALGAAAAATSVNKSMETAMERLASGQRINSAADDAAGVSISTRMTAQITGLQAAIRNAGDGQALANTAEGSMVEITNMLQRMRELAIQSANTTYSANDRTSIDAEVTQLKTEIDRIAANTTFNGKTLLDGTFSGNLQIGSDAPQTMAISISNMSTSALATSALTNASQASLTAVAKGVAATPNVVDLTFNGNDTYSFTLDFGNTGIAEGTANNKSISVSGVAMAGSDASAIASAINQAVAGNHLTSPNAGADLRGLVTATASGNTVRLTALDGQRVDITSLSSLGAGTMTVNPVTNSSAASKTLEDTSESTTIANTGAAPAVATSASIELESGKKYTMLVNNTQVEYDGTNRTAFKAAIVAAIEATSGSGTAAVADTANTGSTGHVFRITDSTGADIDLTGFQKVTANAVAAGSITLQNVSDGTNAITATVANGQAFSDDGSTGGNALVIATGTTAKLGFNNQDLNYSFEVGSTAYTITGNNDGDFQSSLTTVAAAISAQAGITAVNNGGVLEIANTSGSSVGFGAIASDTLASAGTSALTAGFARFSANAAAADPDLSNDADLLNLVDGSIVSSSNGTVASTQQMSLTFTANDRYTFEIQGAANRTVTADVTNGDLTGMINAINTQSGSTGVTAKAVGNELVLERSGAGFTVAKSGSSDFSDGLGKIIAANAAGQGGTATLEDAGDGATMTVAASGVATPTTLTLTASGADKFSFKISDGTSTATVRATTVAADDAAEAGDTNPEMELLLAEINTALAQANMTNITASNTNDVITLTNRLGGEIKIENFKSDSTGTLSVAPGVGQGVAKVLDDAALAGSNGSIADISVLTEASANAAVDAIDRAFEKINLERSNLGAISNRLDHTVSNLTNIVLNTEDARSRILDTDFAAESTNLAKAQILQQASMAMLAQANASKQSVLSLLQG